jgi:hypothetical protein
VVRRKANNTNPRKFIEEIKEIVVTDLLYNRFLPQTIRTSGVVFYEIAATGWGTHQIRNVIQCDRR